MGAGKAMVGEPDNVNPNVAKKTIDVTVAMFFDGTGNNMYNTDEADKQSDIYKKNTDHGCRLQRNIQQVQYRTRGRAGDTGKQMERPDTHVPAVQGKRGGTGKGENRNL